MLPWGKIVYFLFCSLFILAQSGLAQTTHTLDLSHHFTTPHKTVTEPDTFRPLHLRYLSYSPDDTLFSLLIDKGSRKEPSSEELNTASQTLMRYFLIGITLPNDTFWVNLRPDEENSIIDDRLAKTDIGRIMLEADLQLKKDTARFTSPQTPEGRHYWDKLYKKAEELFSAAGTEENNMVIPTITRPWIVPGEIIMRETQNSAYIYKATLKVLLEEDHLKSSQISALSSQQYNFEDSRLKALNEYSTQLIRETIIPKLTKEINSSERYAPLRQVYYSLILSQWFKARNKGKNSSYALRIDTGDLAELTSKQPWEKTGYFEEYRKSFHEGEYSLKEPRYTREGNILRTYTSGGLKLAIRLPEMSTEEGSFSSPIFTRLISDLGKNNLAAITLKGEENSFALAHAASSLTENTLWQGHSRLVNTGLTEETCTEIIGALNGILGHRGSDNSVITVSGKNYPFNGGRNKDHYRLGPLIFITLNDLRRYQKDHFRLEEVPVKDLYDIIKRTQNSLFQQNPILLKNAANLLFVSPLSDVDNQPINRYSALMLAGMLSLSKDFDGATVIDAGSGSGLLSLTALRLGAKTAILIENDPSEIALSRALLKAHGYEEGIDFIIPNKDLSEPGELLQELLNIFKDRGKEKIIGLGNIGPWKDYKEANKNAVELFMQLQAKYIFNGGYLLSQNPHVTDPEIKEHQRAFDAMKKLFANSGYQIKDISHLDNAWDRQDFRLLIGSSSQKQEKASAGSALTVTTTAASENALSLPSASGKHGGIDLRSLPIPAHTIDSLSARVPGRAINTLREIDLTQEWQDLEEMCNAGITPSAQRMIEYIQASSIQDGPTEDRDKVLFLISDLLRKEEAAGCQLADPALKDILVVLESLPQANELRQLFFKD